MNAKKTSQWRRRSVYGMVLMALLTAGIFHNSASAQVTIDWQVVASAGAVPSSASAYKLFSVTGQPSPVGRTASSTNAVLHGFMLAPDGHASGCCNLAGDANNDGGVNVADAVFLINHVFKGGAAPPCLQEGDANGDGNPNVGDAVRLINYVFRGGEAPVCGA